MPHSGKLRIGSIKQFSDNFKEVRVGTNLRVIIVVPHEVERAGLRLLIEQDASHKVVGEAANAEECMRLAERCKPDIALLDDSLSNVAVLGLMHMLAFKCPRAQILLYIEPVGQDWLRAAIRGGARGFVLKTRVAKNLTPALQALSDRRPYWENAVDDELLDTFLETGPRPPPSALTSREWQILKLAAQDQSSKEMALTLAISPKTIERHRTAIRRKLGFRNRTELIRYAELGGRTDS